MNIRAEFEAIVSRPGKFEGEPAYVPYFWNMESEDGVDYLDDDSIVRIFEVTHVDRAIFPELDDTTSLELTENDQGFVTVYSETFSGIRRSFLDVRKGV